MQKKPTGGESMKKVIIALLILGLASALAYSAGGPGEKGKKSPSPPSCSRRTPISGLWGSA
jgi:hypothetical protein